MPVVWIFSIFRGWVGCVRFVATLITPQKFVPAACRLHFSMCRSVALGLADQERHHPAGGRWQPCGAARLSGSEVGAKKCQGANGH